MLDFTANRHRLELVEHNIRLGTYEMTKIHNIRTFDGKALMGVKPWTGVSYSKGKVPSDKNVDGGISEGDLTNAAFADDLWPFFLTHGIVAFTPQHRIVPGKWKLEYDLGLLSVHGQAIDHGRPCLVLRTPPRKGAATLFLLCGIANSMPAKELSPILVRNWLFVHRGPFFQAFGRLVSSARKLALNWTVLLC